MPVGPRPPQHARPDKEWEGAGDEEEAATAPRALNQGAAAAQPVRCPQRSLHAMTWPAALMYMAKLKHFCRVSSTPDWTGRIDNCMYTDICHCHVLHSSQSYHFGITDIIGILTPASRELN